MSCHQERQKTSVLQSLATFAYILFAGLLLILPAPALAAYPQNPLLLEDTVYVSHQGIFKFNLEQPDPLWSSLVGIHTFAPVVAGNLVLVGSSQGLYALDMETGNIAWRIQPQHTVYSPGISERSGIAYAGSLHGELYTIETRGGRINWRTGFTGWIYSPVVDDKPGRLWTGGQSHQMYAIDSRQGHILQWLDTTQESVFSPVDIGNGQVALNLFDGTTMLVEASGARIDTILDGNSPPSDIRAHGNILYRSHRDGTLAAFDRQSYVISWRRKFAPRNLVMHNAQPGHLLLGDNDRTLVLLDLAKPDQTCQIQHDLPWLLPLHFNKRTIIHFRKTIQPAGMALVQTEAHCK